MAHLVTIDEKSIGLYWFSTLSSRLLRMAHNKFSGRYIDHLLGNNESIRNSYGDLLNTIGIAGSQENKKKENGETVHTGDL